MQLFFLKTYSSDSLQQKCELVLNNFAGWLVKLLPTGQPFCIFWVTSLIFSEQGSAWTAHQRGSVLVSPALIRKNKHAAYKQIDPTLPQNTGTLLTYLRLASGDLKFINLAELNLDN